MTNELKGNISCSKCFDRNPFTFDRPQCFFSGWPSVGNEGINLYIGILGIHEPSFPTRGQLVLLN